MINVEKLFKMLIQNYREPLEIYPEPIKACREVIAHKVNLFDSADKVKYYYE